MYGPEAEFHTDYLLIKQLIDKAGGYKNTNIFYSSIKHIIDGPWFDIIEESWTNTNRLERCGIMCGATVNLIKDQNAYITYKN
jgi:hypothetical protein